MAFKNTRNTTLEFSKTRKQKREQAISTILDEMKQGVVSAKAVEKKLVLANIDTRQPEISWLIRHFEASG